MESSLESHEEIDYHRQSWEICTNIARKPEERMDDARRQ